MTPFRRPASLALLALLGSSVALVACGGTKFGSNRVKESQKEQSPSEQSADTGSNGGPGESDAGKSAGDAPTKDLTKNDPAGIRDSVSDEVKKVIAACAASPKEKRSLDIVFEATTGNDTSACEWKSSPDNADDTIRGIKSQTKSVDLPAGAILCDTRLFSAHTTPWKYDDEVILTLNGVILLASQKGYIGTADGKNFQKPLAGGWSFDWEALAAQNFKNEHAKPEDRYCYGSDASKCSIPVTEEQGQVKLDLATNALAPLSAKALADKKVEFKLWVTGDNEKNIDCKHSGITIKAEVEFVKP